MARMCLVISTSRAFRIVWLFNYIRNAQLFRKQSLISPEAMLVNDLLRYKRHCPIPNIVLRVAPITLAVKRKSANLYEGRLCTRGDVAPSDVPSFTSSPSAHRIGIKISRTWAVHCHWHAHALETPQAFLQSGNLRPEDRIAVLPPPMVALPWPGH